MAVYNFVIDILVNNARRLLRTMYSLLTDKMIQYRRSVITSLLHRVRIQRERLEKRRSLFRHDLVRTCSENFQSIVRGIIKRILRGHLPPGYSQLAYNTLTQTEINVDNLGDSEVEESKNSFPEAVHLVNNYIRRLIIFA